MAKCKCPPPGLPGYMGNLRDPMSLLMCFFVLLPPFAEMDVQKFKQIAGSMEKAFGVQNILEVKDIPKGTSVIAQEFRPGRPEPTPIDTIMQQTIDMTQTELDFQPGDADKAVDMTRPKASRAVAIPPRRPRRRRNSPTPWPRHWRSRCRPRSRMGPSR